MDRDIKEIVAILYNNFITSSVISKDGLVNLKFRGSTEELIEFFNDSGISFTRLNKIDSYIYSHKVKFNIK